MSDHGFNRQPLACARGGLHEQVQGRAGRARALRRGVPGGRADGVLLDRGRPPRRAQRSHPRPAPERRVASTARAAATRPSPTGRRAGSRSSIATTVRTTRTTRPDRGGVRGAAARNILKAWLLVALLTAGVRRDRLAARRRPRRAPVRVLLAARRERRVPVRRPGAPRDARRATVRARRGSTAPLDDRSPRGAARHPASEAPADRRRLPARVRRRPRAAWLHARGQLGPPDAASRRPSSRRSSRTSSRTSARATCSTQTLRRAAVDDARRAHAGRRLAVPRSCSGARSRRSGVHPPAALAEARARGRRRGRTVRRSPRSRRRADPPRSRGGARRVPRLAGDRAALHGEPVRPTPSASRACSSRTRRSPSASRGCVPSASSRLRADRRPAGRPSMKRREPPLAAALGRKPAASYSPGGLRPKYHRRWRA